MIKKFSFSSFCHGFMSSGLRGKHLVKGRLSVVLLLWGMAIFVFSCGDDEETELRPDPQPSEEEPYENEEYEDDEELVLDPDPEDSVPGVMQSPGQSPYQGSDREGVKSGKYIPQPFDVEVMGVDQEVSPREGGDGTGADSSEGGQHKRFVLDTSQQAVTSMDVLWIFDNSVSMRRLGFNKNMAQVLRKFIDLYVRDKDIKIGVVSAMSEGVESCVKPILSVSSYGSRVRDYNSYYLDLSSYTQVTKINCGVESLSTLAAASEFLSKGLQGVLADDFFRSDSLKAFVVVSDDLPMQVHVPVFQEALKNKYPAALTSFSSISSSKPNHKKSFVVGKSNKLAAPYTEYREQAFKAQCGNFYTESYTFLTQSLGGVVGQICDKKGTSFLQKFMVHLRERRGSLLSLASLSGVQYSVAQVRVNGMALGAEKYEVVSSGVSSPLLWIKDPKALVGSSEVELFVNVR